MKNLNDEQKNLEKENEKPQNEEARRNFMKKAVYAAPTLLAMGSLLKPKDILADGSQPPGPPNWP